MEGREERKTRHDGEREGKVEGVVRIKGTVTVWYAGQRDNMLRYQNYCWSSRFSNQYEVNAAR